MEPQPSSNFEKYRNILRDNGIKDEILDINESSPPELQGAGMTSSLLYVTVKFKDSAIDPLHLFVKMQSPVGSRSKLVEDMKLVEKEVRFLTKYVPAVQEFCASKG